MAEIPLLINKGDDPGPRLVPHAFIWPHVWFAFLFEFFRTDFELRFLGARGADGARRLARFWGGVRADDPRRERNPNMAKADLVTRGIPIALHGDGVPCTKRLSLMVLSWFGLLGIGTTREIAHFLSADFNKSAVEAFHAFLGGVTTKAWFWRRVVWSLRVVETGFWPERDWDDNEFPPGDMRDKAGTPLAGGYYCVLWGIRGDSEWNCNHLELPGHWSSRSPCTGCRATGLGEMAGMRWDY